MRSIRLLSGRVTRLTMAAVVMASCTTATDPIPIATITLLPALDSIEVGATYNNWIVSLKDAAGQAITGRTLTWASNNPPVASIDASTGVVTGVAGGGDAIITVRAEGKEAGAVIKVLYPVLSIVSAPDSFDVPLTSNRQIQVQLVGPNGLALTNRAIVWSSSNPSVAVVSTSGIVTPVSLGTVTVTIRASTKQTTVRVRVVGEPVTSVRISPNQAVHVLRLGQVKQLTAECLSASQQVLAGRPIVWGSGNPVIASISQTGLVTANALGSAPISATCDNTVSAFTTAQVTPIPVSSVSIQPGSLTISQFTQGQLLVTARDSANNVLSLQGRTVTWTSNNNPVAQVNGQGVVTGVSVGSAEIQVSVDGVVSTPAIVTVQAPMFSMTPARDRSSLLAPPEWTLVRGMPRAAVGDSPGR